MGLVNVWFKIYMSKLLSTCSGSFVLIGQGNSPCWHTSSGGYGPGQEAGSRRGPEVSRDVTKWPQDELRLAASVTALYYETQEDVTNLMEFVPDQKTLHTDELQLPHTSQLWEGGTAFTENSHSKLVYKSWKILDISVILWETLTVTVEFTNILTSW